MKKIFIITLNFNSEQQTHECITSLKNLIIPKNMSVEILVVDNGSKIPFITNAAEKKSGIQVLRLDKNVGFTGGNNEGISYSLSQGADFIMLLNNDTFVDVHLLNHMIPIFDSSSVGLVAPKIYFAKGHEFHHERYSNKEKGHVLWYAGGGIDWNNVFSYHRGVDEVDKGQYDQSEEVTFATGCCMLISKEVIQAVGMFDDRYFLYYEDADLCMRIIKAGFKLIYTPQAVLWHITAASSGGSGSTLHDYFLTRNRMLFGMLYAPFRSKLALARESIRLLVKGRMWQKKGIIDFYRRSFGRGSFDI